MKPLSIADEATAARLWPSLHSSGMFKTRTEYDVFRAAAPWRVLASSAGRAAVLERWRDHMDILAVRGLWCLEREVPEAIEDVCGVAAAQGFAQVLSPLVNEDVSDPYARAGMHVTQRTVVLRQRLTTRTPADDDGPDAPHVTPGTTLRLAMHHDLAALASLDAACFEPFWRNDPQRMADLLAHGHCAVAVDRQGALLGYTHATVEHGEGRIGRLAVAPAHRRTGVGGALLRNVMGFLARAGVHDMTLCTQEENRASRALYARMGFTEMEMRAVFLIRDASPGRGGRGGPSC